MYFMFKRIFFLWLFNIHDLTHTPLFLFVNGFCITVGSPVPALITPSRTTWWIPGIVPALITPTCMTWWSERRHRPEPRGNC